MTRLLLAAAAAVALVAPVAHAGVVSDTLGAVPPVCVRQPLPAPAYQLQVGYCPA